MLALMGEGDAKSRRPENHKRRGGAESFKIERLFSRRRTPEVSPRLFVAQRREGMDAHSSERRHEGQPQGA